MNIEFVGKRVSRKLKGEIESAVALVLDELGQDHSTMSMSIIFMGEKDMRLWIMFLFIRGITP